MKHFFRVLLCVMHAACYHHIQPPTIDVIRVEAVSEENEPSDHDKLQLYLQRYPHFRATVSDALLFIEAEQLASTGDVSGALAKMQAAFAQATGKFQQQVFTRYLDLAGRQPSTTTAAAFFVEHAETHLNYRGRHVTTTIADLLATRVAADGHRADTFARQPTPTHAGRPDAGTQRPTLLPSTRANHTVAQPCWHHSRHRSRLTGEA